MNVTQEQIQKIVDDVEETFRDRSKLGIDQALCHEINYYIASKYGVSAVRAKASVEGLTLFLD
jgi:hypothetical protein